MRNLHLGTVASAFMLVACDTSAPSSTAPALSPAASHVASHSSAAHVATAALPGQPDRPFKGSCELTVEVLSRAFPIVQQRDTGTCQLTHLGRAQFDGVLTINVLLGTQTGTRTITAANGDALYASVQGTSVPIGQGLISFSATFTFTGGTGRFKNASGSAQGNGVANQAAQTSSVSLSGSIRY